MPYKILVIDPAKREVRSETIKSYSPDVSRIIGGYLSAVTGFRNGDTIYVDDEGMLKQQEHFFMFDGYPNPLAGVGVVVGREVDALGTGSDVQTTVEDLTKRIKWMSHQDFTVWAMAQTGPAVGFTPVKPDGELGETVVITDWNQFAEDTRKE
jgi:hypothetical protein